MTVQELINLLTGLPPDQPVLLNGYEGGYYKSRGVRPEVFIENYYPPDEWWYGSHELDVNDLNQEKNLPTFKGILLY